MRNFLFDTRPTSHPGGDSYVYTGYRRFLIKKKDGKFWLHRYLDPNVNQGLTIGPFNSVDAILQWMREQHLYNRKA